MRKKQMSRIGIAPFIKIVDLYKLKVKNKSEYKNMICIVIDELEKEGTSQIILKNWSMVSDEELWQAYYVIKGFCIKCSLMLEYGTLVKLDKFVCNIYKVYQDSSFETDYTMKQYFRKRGIEIWRLMDLRNVDIKYLESILKENEMIFSDRTYEKVILRISNNVNRECILRILEDVKNINIQKIIIFPYMVEEDKYILDIADASLQFIVSAE